MAAIRKLYKDLFQIAAEKRLWMLPLGQIEGETMWLVRSRENSDHDDPKMLIIAGFHGEEHAGPWAVLKWLKTCDSSIFRKVDLSFIPIVNPIGFKKNVRYSIPGEKNNQGFCHPEGANACKVGEKRSREGEILYNHIDMLLPLTKDGFLSLHEDKQSSGYYVYTFEKRQTAFTKGLKNTLGKYFSKPLDGLTTNGLTPDQREIYVGETDTEVKNGWVNHGKLHDGSIEDFLFHANVPRIAVTETPQNWGKYRLQRRVTANIAVIDKYIDFGVKAVRRQRRKELKNEN